MLGLGIGLWSNVAATGGGGGGGGGAAVWAASATWNTASDPVASCTTASFWSLVFAAVAKTASSCSFTIGSLPGGANELYIGLSDGTETVFPGNGANIGVSAASGAIVITGGTRASVGRALVATDVVLFDWSDGVNIVVKLNGSTAGTFLRSADSIPASLKPTASAGNISGAQITLSGY